MQFFGHEREAEGLLKLAESSLSGQSRAALIEGPAGAGKSAIISHLADGPLGARFRTLSYSFHGAALKGPMDELFRLAGDLGAGAPPADWTFFEEIFFLSNDGLLIYHSGSGSAVDEDILGSMLSAVQDFVRDSFGDSERAGGLNELSYKGLKILIEHGEFTYIAAVVEKGEHRSMRDEIVTTLHSLEADTRSILETWNGDLSILEGVQGPLEALRSMRFPRPRIEGEAAVAQLNLRFEWVRNAVMQGSLERPLLIALEDVHLADRTSLGALAYLLRGLRDRPVLVLLSLGTDSAGQAALETLSKLQTEGRLEKVAVEPVDKERLASIIQPLLPDGEISGGLLEAVHVAASGIPGRALDLVKALLHEGRIAREANLWVLSGHGALEAHLAADAIYRILEGLDSDVLSLLELTAVLDGETPPPLLRSGLRFSEEEFGPAVDFATRHGLLRTGGSGTLGFARHGLGEALLSGMGQVRLAAWHRAAARAILDSSFAESDEMTFALAGHYAQGHDAAEGIGWCQKAAELAESRYAFPEAARFYGWAVDLMEMAGAHQDYLATLQMHGAALEMAGDLKGSISAYEKALRLRTVETDLRCEMLRSIGQLHQKMGDLPKAMDSYESALSLTKGTERSIVRARVQNNLGGLISKERPDEAIALHEGYLAIAKESMSVRDMAEGYRRLGSAYFHSKRIKEAMEQWQRALQTFETLNDDFGRSTILYNMGAAYNIMGDFSTSLLTLEEAVRVKERIGDFKGQASALNNFGIAYSRCGEFDKAIEAHKRSIEIKSRMGDLVGIANSYNSIGTLYWQEGRFQEAAEHFTSELDIMTRVGDEWGIAQAHNNLASVLCNLGELEKAARHLARSLEIAQKKDFKDIFAYVQTTRARLTSRYGDWEKSNQEFARALKAAERLGESRHVGITYMNWGEECLRHEDRDAAERFRKALEFFEKAGTAPLASKARALLAKATGPGRT